MTSKCTLLISDLHTNYGVIDEQVLHAERTAGRRVEQVFVLGDFGMFGDKLYRFFRSEQKRFLRPVSFVEGNHEDYSALDKLTDRYADVVTYLPRGTLHEVGPFRGVCLGGARYMDAASTPRGSEIRTADIEACLAHPVDDVDLILSHDCPPGLDVPNSQGFEHYGAPGVPEMAQLAERYRPRWWFFGHHHRWSDFERDGTRYIGLPQSWVGYVLLHADGSVAQVDNEVTIDTRPWWKRLLRGN